MARNNPRRWSARDREIARYRVRRAEEEAAKARARDAHPAGVDFDPDARDIDREGGGHRDDLTDDGSRLPGDRN